MDRDQIAQLLAQRNKMPVSLGEVPAGSEPPPSSWQPSPTTPFGGLTAYDWKNPARQPMDIGEMNMGPTREDLQLLHLLGRRRLPPAISGVGEVR